MLESSHHPRCYVSADSAAPSGPAARPQTTPPDAPRSWMLARRTWRRPGRTAMGGQPWAAAAASPRPAAGMRGRMWADGELNRGGVGSRSVCIRRAGSPMSSRDRLTRSRRVKRRRCRHRRLSHEMSSGPAAMILRGSSTLLVETTIDEPGQCRRTSASIKDQYD
jgi:hypothetical protein